MNKIKNPALLIALAASAFLLLALASYSLSAIGKQSASTPEITRNG